MPGSFLPNMKVRKVSGLKHSSASNTSINRQTKDWWRGQLKSETEVSRNCLPSCICPQLRVSPSLQPRRGETPGWWVQLGCVLWCSSHGQAGSSPLHLAWPPGATSPVEQGRRHDRDVWARPRQAVTFHRSPPECVFLEPGAAMLKGQLVCTDREGPGFSPSCQGPRQLRKETSAGDLSKF